MVSNTVNREIFVSTKFRICNFRVQIFSDASGPSENLTTANYEENCVFEVTMYNIRMYNIRIQLLERSWYMRKSPTLQQMGTPSPFIVQNFRAINFRMQAGHPKIFEHRKFPDLR